MLASKASRSFGKINSSACRQLLVPRRRRPTRTIGRSAGRPARIRGWGTSTTSRPTAGSGTENAPYGETDTAEVELRETGEDLTVTQAAPGSRGPGRASKAAPPAGDLRAHRVDGKEGQRQVVHRADNPLRGQAAVEQTVRDTATGNDRDRPQARR